MYSNLRKEVKDIKVIDTHGHLGISKFSGVETKETEIIEAMDLHHIAASLIMPQPTLEDIPSVHARIARMTQSHKNRIFGIASVDPWLDEQDYAEQIRKCIKDHQFIAIKLHPMGHNISPLSPRCNKVYEAAEFYDVPIIVHTGIGNPNSLPSLVIDPAKRFPKVKFVLAHAGFAVYTDEAIVAAKYCNNIILEPSWCPTYTVKKMINEIGLDRMVMGSDHLSNLPVELTKFKSIGLTEHDLETIFYHNANELFKLNL